MNENNLEFSQEDAVYEILSEPAPKQEDPYTYYAGNPAPSAYRYMPEPKKKKMPWGVLLITILCSSIIGGAMGVGGVLLMQGRQE